MSSLGSDLTTVGTCIAPRIRRDTALLPRREHDVETPYRPPGPDRSDPHSVVTENQARPCRRVSGACWRRGDRPVPARLGCRPPGRGGRLHRSVRRECDDRGWTVPLKGPCQEWERGEAAASSRTRAAGCSERVAWLATCPGTPACPPPVPVRTRATPPFELVLRTVRYVSSDMQ